MVRSGEVRFGIEKLFLNQRKDSGEVPEARTRKVALLPTGAVIETGCSSICGSAANNCPPAAAASKAKIARIRTNRGHSLAQRARRACIGSTCCQFSFN
jgi:hypothetical protein